MMPSTCFETEGSSSGRRYGKECFTRISISSLVGAETVACKTLYAIPVCGVYNRLPEDEPSVSKHAQDKFKYWYSSLANLGHGV
jgi:hypothetical protein